MKLVYFAYKCNMVWLFTCERMCPLPQQIPRAETSKASTWCPAQDKINRMGAGGMWGMWGMW
jgi:hypothetical protein